MVLARELGLLALYLYRMDRDNALRILGEIEDTVRKTAPEMLEELRGSLTAVRDAVNAGLWEDAWSNYQLLADVIGKLDPVISAYVTKETREAYEKAATPEETVSYYARKVLEGERSPATPPNGIVAARRVEEQVKAVEEVDWEKRLREALTFPERAEWERELEELLKPAEVDWEKRLKEYLEGSSPSQSESPPPPSRHVEQKSSSRKGKVDILYLLDLTEKILGDLKDVVEYAEWERWGAAEYRLGDVRYELDRLEKVIGEQPELRSILEQLEDAVKKRSYVDTKVRAFKVFEPALFRILKGALSSPSLTTLSSPPSSENLPPPLKPEAQSSSNPSPEVYKPLEEFIEELKRRYPKERYPELHDLLEDLRDEMVKVTSRAVRGLIADTLVRLLDYASVLERTRRWLGRDDYDKLYSLSVEFCDYIAGILRKTMSSSVASGGSSSSNVIGGSSGEEEEEEAPEEFIALH
jgi:tetratricopeptide (TPR) repeat protein